MCSSQLCSANKRGRENRTNCVPQEGHPRHANGDSEEGEGEEGGGGGGGKGEQGAGEPAGPGPSAPGTTSAAGGTGLEAQVAAMQAQLEEQGRLLRAVAAQLAGRGSGGGGELELPAA